jgi:hypothetical protein
LLGDVRGMCSSAGLFFATVGREYQQALHMHEITLVCVLALEGHDSLDLAASCNVANIYYAQDKYELEMSTKSLERERERKVY